MHSRFVGSKFTFQDHFFDTISSQHAVSTCQWFANGFLKDHHGFTKNRVTRTCRLDTITKKKKLISTAVVLKKASTSLCFPSSKTKWIPLREKGTIHHGAENTRCSSRVINKSVNGVSGLMSPDASGDWIYPLPLPPCSTHCIFTKLLSV